MQSKFHYKPKIKVNYYRVFTFVLLAIIIISFSFFAYYQNNYLGFYNSELDTIVVFPEPNAKVNFSTCAHEIGHYVWYEQLPEEKRQEYIKSFNDANEWLNSYAESSVKEDFAEEFRESIKFVFNSNKLLNDRNFVLSLRNGIFE